MNLDMTIRGALAGIAGDRFAEDALLTQLGTYGLTREDAWLTLEKAVLEGYVGRQGDRTLVKLARAHAEAAPGRLAS